MPITPVQRAAALEVIKSLLAMKEGKRQLAGMFLELVDRHDWPQYYEIIPEPRALNPIRSSVEKGRYKEASDIHTDLSLVFWNAIFYNEPKSQIVVDAKTLKSALQREWKKRSVLPFVRTSPPPSSAQKVHGSGDYEASPPTSPALATAPIPAPTTSVSPPTAPAASSTTNASPQVAYAPSPAPTSAPATRSTPAPAANISATNNTYSRPVAIRPKSAQLSPEVEVDIMSEDGQAKDVTSSAVERDPEGDEIVRQLEKGLPRWPGFGEEGWTEDVSQERMIEIVHAIKSYKDIVGNRLAVALESIPEESTIPFLSFTSSLSLKLIETRARSKNYQTSRDIDMEMERLFLKARRWHKPGTEPYGRVLLLQRLYQSLMSPNPPPPPLHSTTNFAALRAGPGNVKPVHGGEKEGGVAGVTTHRVLTKDRTFVDQIQYKGWTVKLADWVHLSNPDDPSRPIIGQVFRCWVSDEPSKKGQPGLTVSWYYRPEQTFHPSSRMFWEGEVFKTSHFADHPVEDIIEKIACQFTARHVRGRPRPPFWYLGFPLYVCDSRYNDRERTFVKIKNWNSCVPEEVRQRADFMPIYPFERTIEPRTVPSPFLGRGVKGPGGIIAVDPADKQEYDNQGDLHPNGRSLRTRSSGAGDPGPSGVKGYAATSAPGTSAATGSYYQPSNLSQMQAHTPRPVGPDRSVVAAAGGMHALGHGAYIEKLPAETAKHFDRDPGTNEVLWFPAPPVDIARPAKPKYSLAYLHFLATKRKREVTEPEEPDAMDLDDDSATRVSKRGRLEVPPTVTETLRAVLRGSSLQ
ncbi:putative bromo adjacent homology domain containing protein [Lyophyllum shimeji]|uniref:Bromo adjacent homology domain containing protein n=1 Tax=Lyophyllum shimeji TaxID=47721 RepID=A0A9P3PJS4_LYOSH|nr:putative bromo adjacent homology domain containing protein [Lyophyllum shimeji]